MKKLLFILAIFFIGFQNISAQENIENEQDTIFVQAEFKGGVSAFRKFTYSKMRYPRKARKLGIEQRIFVGFVIRPNGYVDNVRVIDNKQLDSYGETEESLKYVELLKKDAVRIIKATNGKWKAGTKNGEKIAIFYTIPFEFRLTKYKTVYKY